ncbi:hypothetical protein PLESTB_000787200 [Pleodorina starrii]|uniref:K Homology domain-containing protein n=1 Tax=Pleodorina starrii TaxID=330485 RepID=A0A9W6F223_9CHLO|nr:hypothetical protein PLESTM_000497500 [Pleodorina starrii]GLC53788.1 hypothetical protein PLESTB_000787200 [Pleodorina starrii]GLC72968.1 hypothetical protein PLESTF_001314900 [Pleodorina starrii]
MQQQPGGGGGRRQTAVVTCPKSMIGRVIGRNGETIKALQTYTGALIQIDQTCDPTKIAISGTPQSLSLALSMVHDIVRGTFKGFALLRQATGHSSRGPHQLSTKPVYAPGYGLIPPSQLYGGETPAGGILHPGAAMLAPRPPGAPGAAPYPPPILSAAPMPAAPHQFVLGVQPMPVTGAALHAPVYNVIGGPTFGTPVYLSPYDYTAPAGSGGAGDVMLLSDGSSLLTTANSNGGGGGNRLFHAAVGGGGGARAHAGGGGLLGAAAGGGMASHNGNGGGGADMLSVQPMAMFGQPGGAANHHMNRNGGGGGGLLPAGTLVMDADGGLYTYTMDG